MALQINGTTVVDGNRKFFSAGNNVYMGTSALAQASGIHNIFIGNDSGTKTTTACYTIALGWCAFGYNSVGKHNIGIGIFAGRGSTDPANSDRNIAIGSYAGCSRTTGYDNIFLGYAAGRYITNGICNVFIGHNSAGNAANGSRNVFIGSPAGSRGNYNVAIGDFAGNAIYGSSNNFIGRNAGYRSTSGCSNNFIGENAGYCNTTGSCNNFFGCGAGYKNTSGICNVFIGRRAGCVNETGSNNIFINNTGSNVSNQTCIGNTNTVTTYTFGDFISEGNVTAYSDESLKENIERIQNALEKVRSLEGVTYNRNDYPDKPRHMGLIAQCVEKVIPEVIGEADGKLTVAYGNLIALVVEAIKEIDERLEILEGK